MLICIVYDSHYEIRLLSEGQKSWKLCIFPTKIKRKQTIYQKMWSPTRKEINNWKQVGEGNPEAYQNGLDIERWKWLQYFIHANVFFS